MTAYMTLVNELDVDHGLTVPMSLMFGRPEVWPVKRYRYSSTSCSTRRPGNRCWLLGEPIRRAVESFDEDQNVQIWGTGGMSHQLQGPRAGLINTPFDQAFMERLGTDPWLIMRGALRPDAKELHRHCHVPASNTAVGHIVLDARA